MPKLKPGETPRSAAYAKHLDDGTWACTREECTYTHAQRSAVQLHQRSHEGHKHKWRALRPRGAEGRAIAAGFSKYCPGCDELAQ